VLGIDFCARFVAAAEKLLAAEVERDEGVDQVDDQVVDQVDDQVVDQVDDQVDDELTWIPNEVGVHDLVLVDFLDRCLNPT
ncbi:unnamed protein product, partial [Lampetra fluviatilis]